MQYSHFFLIFARKSEVIFSKNIPSRQLPVFPRTPPRWERFFWLSFGRKKVFLRATEDFLSPERKLSAARKKIARWPRGGEVLFAAKIMFIPYNKDISNTYSNTKLLCGEEDFTATRGLNQNVAEMVVCPRGGEVPFAVKIMFIPYKNN